MTVHSLGYMRIASPAPERWHTLLTEIVGLMPVDGPTPGALHYRFDDHPPRLVIVPSDESKLEAIGLQVHGRRALETLATRLETAGIAVTEATRDEARTRSVLALLRCTDPAGAPIELYCGPVLDHVPCVTPRVTGFVTGEQGMGHAVLTTPDLDATVAFYIDVLGFEERNRMPTPGGGMAFLSPNERHHSIAVMQAPGPATLLHVMVQMASLDDVGRALDRVAGHGFDLMFTLGRHTNDHMVSFYVYTPDGSAIEVGWGGIAMAMPSSLSVITRPSIWGHRYAPFVPPS